MGGARRGLGYNLQRTILFLAVLLSAVVSAVPALSADTVTRTLFGPETFRKSGGTSFTRTFNVPATEGTFNLHLVNGDGAGNTLVVTR